MSKRILIVDDERQITRMLRMALQSGGYEVLVAGNGAEAFDRFKAESPDLIITDLAMPEMDGVELTRAVRNLADTPIIVLSVRDADSMKIAALDLGADDYITKPFNMPELMARVRVQLRKLPVEEAVPERISESDFLIDTRLHTVQVRGQQVHLTPKEFDLLVFFARHPQRVLTHKMLLKAVWGNAGVDQPEYLRVLIARLRKKVDPPEEGTYILGEPWIGYRFQPELASRSGEVTAS